MTVAVVSVGAPLPGPVGAGCPGVAGVDVTVTVDVCVVVAMVDLPPHPVVAAMLTKAIPRPAPNRRLDRPDQHHQSKRDKRLVAHR